MYGIELLVFGLSTFVTILFFFRWYRPLFGAWPPGRARPARHLLGWLPVVSLAVMVYTLRGLASFDVVDSFFYILFYVLLGYAWLFGGVLLMSSVFDLSWLDDALHHNNRAALPAVAGGFLGLTVLYSAANIGDGPGWWCVIVAGGLGLAAWTALALLVNRFTQVFERVTVERDLPCGVRLGCYLLASALILGRASAGDWTSFAMTLAEFRDGWPALPLAALFTASERYHISKSLSEPERAGSRLPGAVGWGAALIVLAVASILLLPPLPENPLYRV